MPEIYHIELLRDGVREPSTIEVAELHHDRSIRLILRANGILEHSEESDCFAALQAMRRRLSKRGIDLHCYGSSRNVFPSAMSRDMSRGRKAYKTFIGQPGRDIVGIFDSGSDIELVSVDDQEAFHHLWFASLGQKRT